MGRNSSTTAQLFYSILFLCFVLALLGSSCWWLLKTGVSVDHLAVRGVDIRQLSLRVDQGLILRVGQLDLPGPEATAAAADWERQDLSAQEMGAI